MAQPSREYREAALEPPASGVAGGGRAGGTADPWPARLGEAEGESRAAAASLSGRHRAAGSPGDRSFPEAAFYRPLREGLGGCCWPGAGPAAERAGSGVCAARAGGLRRRGCSVAAAAFAGGRELVPAGVQGGVNRHRAAAAAPVLPHSRVPYGGRISPSDCPQDVAPLEVSD